MEKRCTLQPGTVRIFVTCRLVWIIPIKEAPYEPKPELAKNQGTRAQD